MPGTGGNNENNNDGDQSNEEKGNSFLTEVKAQTTQGENESKIYYILIENVNNETKFVPDKAALTDGFTVVWINNDSTKDHQLVITTDKGEQLFNSVVHYNKFVIYKFESEGMYFYSDSENPELNGVMTIVATAKPEVKISEPLPGIEAIISSLGIK